MASVTSQEHVDFHNHRYGYDNSDAVSSAVDGVDESNPRKRRKISDPMIHQNKKETRIPHIQWRSHTKKTIYCSKLVQALRRNATQPNAGRDVRDAADRALAYTAKGRTRWSRAILASPLDGSRFGKVNKHKKVKKKVTGCRMLKKKKTDLSKEMNRRTVMNGSRRMSPTVHLHKKFRVLGKLVPGCRKVSLPNLLEEATDYIAALEMQVQAMKELLAVAGDTPADRVH